ncbi:hypothetical protein BGZ79_007906 [Entomortierella chlamydospora]|nr:hypothetical protein BGZ79_007906 [Entomortierella chlamydospora]
MESRRSSATYSSFSFSSLHSSPTLIRRYLDKDVDAASIRTSMTSVTIDSVSNISLRTSTVTVTPVTAVATITGRLEGTKPDDLSCIDNDALSTSSTSVDDEALDSEAMNGTLKSHQDQTHPNTSPAQEACSKIIEQNNERHRRNLVETQPRFSILGGHSSHPSVTNKSTITTITAITTTTTTTAAATTTPITATDPKYQQQVCVSSIESFPTHDIPDSKLQQLWDLFRFSRSTPMDYTPKQIMTTKDESCH